MLATLLPTLIIKDIAFYSLNSPTDHIDTSQLIAAKGVVYFLQMGPDHHNKGGKVTKCDMLRLVTMQK